ncbi:MAG TPA: alpha-L-rhamnosidase C-terminal domain-containing protein [Planctomycetota bacterium]|nr:alpha-L-rhamnosidase C-terminal domain-containing protein [Planctomycetota bacterium]
MDWNAQWIWHPDGGLSQTNLYLYARRELTLASVPHVARARLTACSLYRLFVNGQPVARGPAPSEASYQSFDVVDLAPFLRPGANAIALEVYHYFDVSPGIIGQNGGRGGILFELDDGDGRMLLGSDAGWRVIQAPPWDQRAAMNSTLFADYKETYDSRREIPSWREAGFDDRAWPEARALGRPPLAPWTLVEREHPRLGGETVTAVEAWVESASVTYAWRDDWEVYGEQRLAPSTGRATPGKYVEVTRTHDDFVPAILLDFGTLVTGYVELRIHDSAGGVIDLSYGEDLRLVRVDRLILGRGAQTLTPFGRRTFRYLKLHFPEAPPRILIDAVELHMATYPVEARGAFACSDDTLNRIHAVAAYTMRLSMLDHFVDCPWRERTIYGGDIYVENLFAAYAFGDQRLSRHTVRAMFHLQHDDGQVPPYGPYRHDAAGFYPSWAAYTALAACDDYALTADAAALARVWPNIAKLCDWTLAEMERNRLPLVGDPDNGGDYATWSAGAKTRYAAWSTLPYATMLRRAAETAASTGRREESARWAAAGARYADAVRAHLTGDGGLFAPLPRADTHRANQHDIAIQGWAGLFGAGDESAACAALVSSSVEPIETPFLGFFVLESLYAHGAGDDALAFMRRYWGEMLRRGATTFWEFFSLGWPAHVGFARGTSACHGWAAAPAYALPARVVGIRPDAPGFERIVIEPQLGDLAWAEATVPTPHGPARARWSASDSSLRGELDLPRPGRVVLRADPATRIAIDGAAASPRAVDGRWSIDVPAGRHALIAQRDR